MAFEQWKLYYNTIQYYSLLCCFVLLVQLEINCNPPWRVGRNLASWAIKISKEVEGGGGTFSAERLTDRKDNFSYTLS